MSRTRHSWKSLLRWLLHEAESFNTDAAVDTRGVVDFGPARARRRPQPTRARSPVFATDPLLPVCERDRNVDSIHHQDSLAATPLVDNHDSIRRQRELVQHQREPRRGNGRQRRSGPRSLESRSRARADRSDVPREYGTAGSFEPRMRHWDLRRRPPILRPPQRHFVHSSDNRNRRDTLVGEAHGVRVRPSAASGLLLIAYLVAVPAATPTIWTRAHDAQSPRLALALVASLLALWCVVVIRLLHTVWRQRHGQTTSGGFGWLAGLMLSMTSFMVGPAVAATSSAADVSQSVHHHTKQASVVSASAGLPIALMAKRRRDELKQLRVILEEGEVEDVINELQAVDEALIQRVIDALPPDDCGLIDIEHFDATGPVAANVDSPVLVVPVRNERKQWKLAYARPGGTIAVPTETNLQALASVATALHRDGRIVVTSSSLETVRQLALRPSPRVMVLHLGSDDLDSDIARLCVRVAHRAEGSERLNRTAEKLRSRRPAELVATRIFVRLLRPVAVVEGLSEAFNSDLRRRCIEMTAYLAVHRHDVVTGDRLRARVLGGGNSDASPRTLANTASAVRRSLGTHGSIPRLLPVTSGGHYRTEDVSSDLERFHALVALAQEQSAEEFVCLTEAMSLIEGEPLSAELRGFEWFLAEGHLARLQRDAEWAALRLAQLAITSGDFDMAYYALERGQLIDPYSDDIVAALARVPRRRDLITTGDADSYANLDAMEVAERSTSPSEPAVEYE